MKRGMAKRLFGNLKAIASSVFTVAAVCGAVPNDPLLM